jgi:hypothetical protein
MPITDGKRKREASRKTKTENLRRRKISLFKKAYEISTFFDVGATIILRSRKTGQFFTFRSTTDLPLSMEQIVSPDLIGIYEELS